MALTPMKAIRAKCMDCSNQQFQEVRLCPCVKFPLYAYRMGHRPPKDKSIEEDDRISESSDTEGFFDTESEVDDE